VASFVGFADKLRTGRLQRGVSPVYVGKQPLRTTIQIEVSALLVSDLEREHTVGLLRAHWLSGRLTAEEFEERVAEAWRARFAADLWHALRFLPGDGPPARPAKSGAALASLVLAILAICLLFMSFGILFLITLPLAVTAWSLGREARRSGAGAGRRMAIVGERLGIAATLFSLLPLAAWATMAFYVL
jgi:Domain of unknown function (DUF1707)